MAWTTPGTATAGQVLTASFWNEQVRDNMLELAPLFGAWTSYTPTLRQGVSTNITKTVTYAAYVKIGRLAIVQVRLDATGAGTAGSNVEVTLPSAVVPVGASGNAGTFGFGQIYDVSTGTNYAATVRAVSTTAVSFNGDWSGTAYWGNTPNLAVANGDQFHFAYVCETTT